jgi:hypothetical protein
VCQDLGIFVIESAVTLIEQLEIELFAPAEVTCRSGDEQLPSTMPVTSINPLDPTITDTVPARSR